MACTRSAPAKKPPESRVQAPAVAAVPRCAPGLGDCDGNAENGCETSLEDATHCGACEMRCDESAVCMQGECRSGVLEVAAGGSHTCARTASGRVYCWGLSSLGQLGLTDKHAKLRPTEVPALSGALQLAAGRYFTCFRTKASRVGCVGDEGQRGDDPPTGGPVPYMLPFEGVVDITAGANHACALLKTGEAHCWGGNVRGQLGDGVTLEYQVAPVAVAGLAKAVDLEAGNAHTCARTAQGTVTCWGMNLYGQLGDDTTEDRPTPTEVDGLSEVEQLSAGEWHTCARTAAGQVHCFGRNQLGQLGVAEPLQREQPAKVELPPVYDVAAGERHTCACAGDGHVYCFGDNESGQLGLGDALDHQPLPTQVPLPGRCRNVYAGAAHTCALMVDGRLYCFGLNDGQIGDSTAEVRAAPVEVSFDGR